jgi:hypothetical protein
MKSIYGQKDNICNQIIDNEEKTVRIHFFLAESYRMNEKKYQCIKVYSEFVNFWNRKIRKDLAK